MTTGVQELNDIWYYGDKLGSDSGPGDAASKRLLRSVVSNILLGVFLEFEGLTPPVLVL